MAEPTLYERLGGIFAIAAVVDQLDDSVIWERSSRQGAADGPWNGAVGVLESIQVMAERTQIAGLE